MVKNRHKRRKPLKKMKQFRDDRPHLRSEELRYTREAERRQKFNTGTNR